MRSRYASCTRVPGLITESDILLASASDAIIIGFNVRPSDQGQGAGRREHVDIRSYDVIYHALEDIRKAMVGMLEPTFVEEVIGNAEVRQPSMFRKSVPLPAVLSRMVRSPASPWSGLSVKVLFCTRVKSVPCEESRMMSERSLPDMNVVSV